MSIIIFIIIIIIIYYFAAGHAAFWQDHNASEAVWQRR